MKRTNAEKINKRISKLKKKGVLKTKDLSDTYHTFDDLYRHRMVLTLALCRLIKNAKPEGYSAYRSWKHSNGTMFNNMFIVVIESPYGQVSYHYGAQFWHQFNGIKILNKAKEYDGHTPEDVIVRLMSFWR